jgi:hypothetical protein
MIYVLIIDQILSNPIITRKTDNIKQIIILLQTIKFPKNLNFLTDRLPQSNYVKFGHKIIKKNVHKSQEPMPSDILNRVSPYKRRADNDNHQSPSSLDKNKNKYYNQDGTPKKPGHIVNIQLIDKNSAVLPDLPRHGSPKKNLNEIKKNNNEHLNQIYQLYVPYLKNNKQQPLKYSIQNEKSAHIKNIEKYYDSHNVKPKKLVSRKILNRKLSPIKRALLNL